MREECFSDVATRGERRGETRRRTSREQLHDTTSAATVLAHNPTAIQRIVHHSPAQPRRNSDFIIPLQLQQPFLCGGMDSAWTHPTTSISSFGEQRKNTNQTDRSTMTTPNLKETRPHRYSPFNQLPCGGMVSAWTHPTSLTPSFSERWNMNGSPHNTPEQQSTLRLQELRKGFLVPIPHPNKSWPSHHTPSSLPFGVVHLLLRVPRHNTPFPRPKSSTSAKPNSPSLSHHPAQAQAHDTVSRQTSHTAQAKERT